MAIVVVGGQSRNVGKTSVVAGLIAALSDRQWTAIKISQHGHDLDTREGLAGSHFAVSEEFDRSGQSDTARYLAAGARRALWVRTRPGHLVEAMPQLHRELAGSANAILESNSVIEFLSPDLYLTVLDPSLKDCKPSARQFLDLADAVILPGPQTETAEWTFPGKGGAIHPVAGKPVFRVFRPEYINGDLIDFVRKKLAAALE
jgi:hypothetical protein